jgi:1-pyrroline-4-hydroxy-2-carboxylate deaminase
LMPTRRGEATIMMLDMARVYAATPTFFDRDLKFDSGRLTEHYRKLKECGVGGLTPNGSLGEYHALDDEERVEAVRIAVEVAGPDMVVVPGVASLTTDGSVRWTEQARDAGADGVMALPPTGYRASPAEILAH